MTWHGISPGQSWRRKRDGRCVEVVAVTSEQIGAWVEVQDCETRQLRWVRVSGLLERYERVGLRLAANG